jgi:hypothetical protein
VRAFSSLGVWYDDFRPTEDAEVVELLARRFAGRASPHDRKPSAGSRPTTPNPQ